MDAERLREIREMVEKASDVQCSTCVFFEYPPPRGSCAEGSGLCKNKNYVHDASIGMWSISRPEDVCVWWTSIGATWHHVNPVIAHAREDIPALLAVLDEVVGKHMEVVLQCNHVLEIFDGPQFIRVLIDNIKSTSEDALTRLGVNDE